ncbi:Tyrosine-protein phosphatase non-receptor type 3 [Papilio xuthus]|uniref:protein-tyrosine-phosphatase n=1 Tax=Papilio xuthus TaxID=66420 RepID=A0A194Q7C9_PAPXU|nr:Tyrosine-protein phosphatase non-receptor type 3 [Papilio xuthus]
MIESVSRRAFSSSSGTYNVRASELARERKLNIFNVTVQFLDETQQSFQIEKKAKGSVLLELVFQHLELVEKDYFGLQFTENGSPPSATNSEITRWLDSGKSVKKQVGVNAQFWLAVRFYPPEPSRLSEEFTRYLLCLQLRKLLLDGRMTAPKNTALLLASFTVQVMREGFLNRWLDSGKSVKKQVGVNAQFWLAVRFYPPEPSRLSEEFTRYLLCLQLRKLLLDGRMTAPKNTALLLASFTVQAELGDYNANEHGNGYLSSLRLLNRQSTEDERRIRELHKLHRGQSPADAEANFLEHAKRLDCYGVESHPAKDYNGKDIFIGVTSIGIVVFQNTIRVNTFSWSKIVKISFKKKQFFIQLKREPSESYDTVLGFNMQSSRAAKALWRCSVERHGFFRLRAPRRRPLLALTALGLTAPTLARTETQALEDARRSRSSNRSFVRRSSSRTRERSNGACAPSPALTAPRGARVTHDEPPPKPAWGDQPADEESGGDILESVLRVPLSYADESESSSCGGGEGVCEGEGEGGAGGAVCVRLAAGADGRFGFNVRGGGNAPVLVSRVAPRTRAMLQEGDQVMSINDKDVDEMTHDEVVQMIRNTKGVLTLIVKPNAVYSAEETLGTEEPEACFVPLVGGSVGVRAAEQSLLLLGDGLASGAALRQYEALVRRLDYPATAARRQCNLAKNRYRDIAPYDSTRVVLKNGPTGDYINASYINMEIPNSDIMLTYIATQGPLASTVGDFWQMVWESESSLIVRRCPVAERGRAKCHQYWPKVGTGPLNATDSLTIVTHSEHNLGHYIRREMTIKDADGASRNVTQLQYTAWPDHGVPEDAAAFISFTQLCSKLRNHRAVMPRSEEEMWAEGVVGVEGVVGAEDVVGAERVVEAPLVVHCSAGVGRTGALVLAETALQLLHTHQPLYPLDLVRAMRAQRPMCIQNASQYKFVCESILAAYAQGLTKPEQEQN